MGSVTDGRGWEGVGRVSGETQTGWVYEVGVWYRGV